MGLFDLYLRHGHYCAALQQLVPGEAGDQLQRWLHQLRVHPERAARRAHDPQLRTALEQLGRGLPAGDQALLREIQALFAASEPAERAFPECLAGVGAVLGFVALGEAEAERPCGLAVPWVAEADREAEEPPVSLAADAVAARGRARSAVLELVLRGFDGDAYLLRRLLQVRCGPRLRGFERRLLRGDSLGLPHFCALFSYVFELPIDPRFAVAGALARHDPSFATAGALGSLGGHLLKPVSLQGKVRSLLLDAPWVQSLVLPAANVRELRADAVLGPALRRAGIALLPGRDLLEVVEHIFPEQQRSARWSPARWRCLRSPDGAALTDTAGPWPLAVSGSEQEVATRCQGLAAGWPAVYRLDPERLLPFLAPDAPLESLLDFLRARFPSGPRSLFAGRLRATLASGGLGLWVERLCPGGGAAARGLLFAALEALARSYPRAPVLLACTPGLAPAAWRQETLQAASAEDFLAWLRQRLEAAVGAERAPCVLRASADLACATSIEPRGVPERRLLRDASERAGRQAAERALQLLESWGVLERRDDVSADATRLAFLAAQRQAVLVGEALRGREAPENLLRRLFEAAGEDARLLLRPGFEAALPGCPPERAAGLRRAWQELCV